MAGLESLVRFIPAVRKPKQRLGFNDKLKWTSIVLLIYFVLGMIPLYGLDPKWETDYFQAVRAIIAGRFGSILTLGIGPIVTAGIILQLLVGVKLLPLDLSKDKDKQIFQGISQMLTLVVALLEGGIYVYMGGLPALNADPNLKLLLVAQLFLGTILISLLDDVSQKWGFISGVSLFIAAGVATEIMVAALNPFSSPQNPSIAAGRIPAALQLIGQGDPSQALSVVTPIIFTIIVFLIAVYAQSINVEIPLAFGRIAGMTTRWPLNLFYTSNMPVILVAALIANIQLWARLAQNAGFPFLGTVVNNSPATGIIFFLTAPTNLVSSLLNPFTFFSGLAHDISALIHPSVLGTSFYNLTYLTMILRAFTFTIFMVVGAVIFSVFWVKLSGQDTKSVAQQINNAGMQVRGFRSDPRVIEMVLDRYIPYLTIIGGAAVGLLAALADFTNAIGGGTGILLTVMIVYKMYEGVVKQHLVDMAPVLKGFVAGNR
jgi:preprotein translocase subunit SecY